MGRGESQTKVKILTNQLREAERMIFKITWDIPSKITVNRCRQNLSWHHGRASVKYKSHVSHLQLIAILILLINSFVIFWYDYLLKLRDLAGANSSSCSSPPASREAPKIPIFKYSNVSKNICTVLIAIYGVIIDMQQKISFYPSSCALQYP